MDDSSRQIDQDNKVPKNIFILPQQTDFLSGSTADEEPLVDGAIDGGRGEILVGGEGRKLVRGNTAAGVLDSDVGGGDTAGGSLAGDETLPGFVALTDDVHGVAVVIC